MKTLLSFVLVAVLAACGGAARPPLPSGVTCDEEALATVNEVPDKANPDHEDYEEFYAVGWYLGHGCEGVPPDLDL